MVKKPKHKKVTHWMRGSRRGKEHGYEKVACKEYDIKEMDEYLDAKWLMEGVKPRADRA